MMHSHFNCNASLLSCKYNQFNGLPALVSGKDFRKDSLRLSIWPVRIAEQYSELPPIVKGIGNGIVTVQSVKYLLSFKFSFFSKKILTKRK